MYQTVSDLNKIVKIMSFKRKLLALGHPAPDKFDISSDSQMRNIVVWLEDQKIRQVKSLFILKIFTKERIPVLSNGLNFPIVLVGI